MRLTHVLQMALPAGRVSTCATPLTADPSRPLPISFDQRRHVEVGDRPGSWLALSFRLSRDVDRAELGRAWEQVVARHGTLRTVFSRRGGELALHAASAASAEWTDHDGASGEVREVVRDALDATCRPFGAPSHRLVLIEPNDAPPVVMIAADHSHIDMWSLLVLARDLLAALEGGELGAAPDFAEHTALLQHAPPAPASVAAEWDRIMSAGGGRMPVFPLPLGDVSEPLTEVVEVRDVLDAAGYAALSARAEATGTRVAALAMSVLAGVTVRLAHAPLRAVFPVHSRFESRWHDAVGWFITNAVIDDQSDDPREGAAAVKRALALGSHPLEPLLEPWGGMLPTPGMFAVSWLDARRIPVSLAGLREVQWVSASLQTDGVMIWFLATDDGLHLRVRYPDTPEARANVGRWVDTVAAALAP